MTETVIVAALVIGVLVWSILLSIDVGNSYRKHGNRTAQDLEDPAITRARAIRENQEMFEDLLSIDRSWMRPTAQAPPQIRAPVAPTAPEVPKDNAGIPIPGAWSLSEETPPYFVYTERGEKKVTYRGDPLYNQIIGATKQ